MRSYGAFALPGVSTGVIDVDRRFVKVFPREYRRALTELATAGRKAAAEVDMRREPVAQRA